MITTAIQLARMTKARRSAAAKKAARTRKRNAKKKKAKKTAKKAKAAGTQSEVTYVTQLKKKGYDIILNGKGIPDIIAHSKNGWEFFEIKPYKKRSGYSRKTGKWSRSGKSRFLNKNQIKKFRELIIKRQKVSMVYYYRKKHGQKNNPKLYFQYQGVPLKKSDMKRKERVDPVRFEEQGRLHAWKTR